MPDNTPVDKLPFGKQNPVDWMTGKRLVKFRKEKEVPFSLPGGNQYQVLQKETDADGDYDWGWMKYKVPT